MIDHGRRDPLPYPGTLHDIARALPVLTQRAEIEAALDELEYLFEVIPPGMQEYAGPDIEASRKKMAVAS